MTYPPRRRPGPPVWPALLTCVLLLAYGPAPAAVAQPAEAPTASAAVRDHTPRGALWRAAALPGWGQVYNRQYVKLPFVYAALGGVAATAVYLDGRYRLHRCAYRYKAWEEFIASGQAGTDTNPFGSCVDEYREVTGGRDVSSAAIRPLRDNLRRNRDLSFIGTGVVYGLSILDAYVSAHLLDFDVGEDLSLRVVPAPDGSLSAHLRLTF